jgi:hypothetical protein
MINYFRLQEIKRDHMEKNILQDDNATKEIFKIIINYLIKGIKFNSKRINLSMVDILVNKKFLGEKIKI